MQTTSTACLSSMERDPFSAALLDALSIFPHLRFFGGSSERIEDLRTEGVISYKTVKPFKENLFVLILGSSIKLT